MKNIKRGLSIAIVAAMVLGMTACGGSGKTESAGKAAEKKSFSLKLSHYRAEGSPADINAKEFADNVKAADDSLEVVVYPCLLYTSRYCMSCCCPIIQRIVSTAAGILTVSFRSWAMSWESARAGLREP